MTQRRRILLLGIVFAVIAAFIIMRVADRGSARRSLDLATFEQHLADDEVRSVTLLDQDHVVQGELTDGTRYKARFPEQYTDELTREILRADVSEFEVDGQSQNQLVALLLSLLPFVLVLGLLFWFMNQAQGGGRGILGFGRSRARSRSGRTIRP